MLSRNALHVAASRSWRDAYDAIAAAADDSLALEKDLFGKTPDDYWAARPKTSTGGACDIESASAFTSRELARAVYGGRPTIFRGAASNWSDAIEAWSPETLALVDDVFVEAHPIPHGEQSFGISAPRPPESLGAFVRRSFGDDVAAGGVRGPLRARRRLDLADYVFDTGDAADALVRNSSLMPRLLNILRPAPALDAALDGIPRWLHRRDAQDVVQVYVGPTGAGAPFHYHENASERVTPRPQALVAQGAERGRLFGAPPARLVPPRCRSCLHAIDATRNRSVATQDGRRQGRLHLRARSGRRRPSAGELGPRDPE